MNGCAKKPFGWAAERQKTTPCATLFEPSGDAPSLAASKTPQQERRNQCHSNDLTSLRLDGGSWWAPCRPCRLGLHMVKQGLAALATAVAIAANGTGSAAQQPPSNVVVAPPAGRASIAPKPVARADYIIGPEDVLTVVFWHDKDMSGDVVVRPDGKISVPLLRDIEAAGSTPDQLRARLVEAATKYPEDPDATVVVKEIKSRNVYITGNVAKPGVYPIANGMNVLQCIALAGGVFEYADTKNIVVIRTEKGQAQYFKFNYKDVIKQKRTEQNFELRPGDTVVVP